MNYYLKGAQWDVLLRQKPGTKGYEIWDADEQSWGPYGGIISFSGDLTPISAAEAKTMTGEGGPEQLSQPAWLGRTEPGKRKGEP